MTPSPLEMSLYEEHAEQVAFLWALRDAASSDVLYDLPDLCALDDRVEANLDGLRLADEAGLAVAQEMLDGIDAGTAFTVAVLAVERRDLRGLARVLDLAERHPVLVTGIEAALGWAPFEALARILPGLLANRCPAGMQALGLAGCALHRRDPGAALDFALLSANPHLRARALRAAGELGRVDLRKAVQEALRVEDDEACRFAAGWTGALWGEPEATRVLSSLAERGGPFAEQAASMAVRCLPQSAARTWLHGLARSGEGLRAALVGAGALGDAAMVPWLIEQMAEPAAARLAAGAMAMITGADLSRDKLEGKRPKGFAAGPTDDPEDDDVAMDADDSLAWPDVAAVQRWWGKKGSAFRSEQRYLLGRPIESTGLEEVLRGGNQHARAAAAEELCLAGKHKALFEVREQGERQRQRLGATTAG
jgi:uncharacterized protein (TIGR02270 family)